MRKQAQGGFTLIELIVVIVILGILAATALPKFSNLSGDARLASMNAVRGALTATAASAHGQWLLKPDPTVSFEGVTITFATTALSGYPKADKNFALASGITDTDYTFIPPGTTADPASTPGTAADEFAIVPKSIAGTAKAAACYVLYKEASAVNTAPTITLFGSATAC